MRLHPPDFSAAWYPHDGPGREFAAAAGKAVTWTEREARRQGRTPLLVGPQRSTLDSAPPPIVSFDDRYFSTTPRGDQRVTAGGRTARGPVLAYLPDFQTLALAMRHARSSTLAVVEYGPVPLLGWAVETGALNLKTGEPTPDPRTDYQREALDQIGFYGNNGWAKGSGADSASRVLQELQATEPLDAALVQGVMLARGASWRAVDRLAELIEAAAPATAGPSDAGGSRRW